MLKTITAGVAVSLLFGPALAQADIRLAQFSVPPLDGVQTPGPGADNQPDNGPRRSSPADNLGTVPRLDGVQTPGRGRDNQPGR